MLILFEEIAKCMSLLFEQKVISPKLKFSRANQNQIRNQQPRLSRNTLILGRSDNGKDFSAENCRNAR